MSLKLWRKSFKSRHYFQQNTLNFHDYIERIFSSDSNTCEQYLIGEGVGRWGRGCRASCLLAGLTWGPPEGSRAKGAEGFLLDL